MSYLRLSLCRIAAQKLRHTMRRPLLLGGRSWNAFSFHLLTLKWFYFPKPKIKHTVHPNILTLCSEKKHDSILFILHFRRRSSWGRGKGGETPVLPPLPTTTTTSARCAKFPFGKVCPPLGSWGRAGEECLRRRVYVVHGSFLSSSLMRE